MEVNIIFCLMEQNIVECLFGVTDISGTNEKKLNKDRQYWNSEIEILMLSIFIANVQKKKGGAVRHRPSWMNLKLMNQIISELWHRHHQRYLQLP